MINIAFLLLISRKFYSYSRFEVRLIVTIYLGSRSRVGRASVYLDPPPPLPEIQLNT